MRKIDKRIFIVFLIFLCVKSMQLILIRAHYVIDSNDYILFSQNLTTGDPNIFSLRTPFYPFLLRLSDVLFGSYERIIILQIGFSLLGFWLLNILTRKISNSRTAMIVSVLYILSPLNLLDSVISTESISSALMIAFIYGLVITNENKKLTSILITSFILTFLIFTRPQYLIFVLIIPAYFIFKKYEYKFYLIVLIPAVLSAIWMFRIYEGTGMFNMSSLIGYTLINHTGNFIEKAGDEYKDIKDIYIPKRDLNIKNNGHQDYTIWEVRSELEKKLATDKLRLSKILKDLSIDLIIHNPVQYLKSVFYAFSNSLILSPALVLSSDLGTKLSFLRFYKFTFPFYQIVLSSGMFVFLVIMILRLFRKYTLADLLIFLFLSNMLITVIVDSGENARFLFPAYCILYISLAIFIDYMYSVRKQ